MRICGVKLTHDATVAVVKDGVLEFSVELEKMYNQPRYTKMHILCEIEDVLALFDLCSSDIDHWVVDGWKNPVINVNGSPVRVAPYHETDPPTDEETDLFERFQLSSGSVSYRHVAGHVMSAYATSPWAKAQREAYVLVWDGGMQPRVYHVCPPAMRCYRVRCGTIGELYGTLYSTMGLFFGPYKRQEVIDYRGDDWYTILNTYCDYSLAGKLMAYIGDGLSWPGRYSIEYLIEKMMECVEEVSRKANIERNTLAYDEHRRVDFQFLRGIYDFATRGWHDKTILAAIHTMCERMLVKGLERLVPKHVPLCFVGGSALNIKWNSAIRRAGYDLWVPPFPNDCGNAIGQAALEMLYQTGQWHLDWSVYSGPPLLPPTQTSGWDVRGCSLATLAEFLSLNPSEPVVFLLGRAEIGPRALGHRSILMSAIAAENKETLNRIKGREKFRPVAPICLAEYAAEYFDPGRADPYMLFDHKVREEARCRIPAVLHDDGTARLQTVTHAHSPELYELLSEYGARSGVPVLCNTSANESGKGFFPDVESAMRWGKVDHIWSNGFLYSKKEA